MANTLKKTYRKSIELPRLNIHFDQDAESPRHWTNLGYFLTKESKYKSPDGNTCSLYQIMLDTENEVSNTEEHINAIKKEAKEQGIKILAIYPVYRYEHSNVVYRRGTAHGFDYSNCGFYIITDETQKEVGTKKANWEKQIDEELKIYTQWANGEVYSFVLYDENGEVEDSCCGFYDLESMKEYLPEEWQNEDLQDYFEN